jgi:T5SS/PEP-CTERM-associated repeat protein
VSLTGNRLADQLRIGSNTVTFQSSSATSRTLTADNQFTGETLRGVTIGVDSGDVGVVNLAATIGSLTTRAATLGDAAGASGTLNLTASPTVFTINGSDLDNAELIIGRAGAGALNVSGGADVNVTGASANVVLGRETGSLGSATVAGAGSTLNVTAGLQIGLSGQAVLSVTDGGRVQAGSIAIGPQGVLNGNDGLIVGNVSNAGTIAPGTSPGALSIEGNLTQDDSGRILIELASKTGFDELAVTGATSLQGVVVVSLLDDFAPEAGDQFDVFDFAGAVDGGFVALSLPDLVGPLAWDASALFTTGVLAVVPGVAAGDFDENGVVDALDLAAWQAGFGAAESATRGDGDSDDDGDVDGADFLAWQRDLGSGTPPTAPTTALVPEPATFGLAYTWAGFLAVLRRRRRGRASSARP